MNAQFHFDAKQFFHVTTLIETDQRTQNLAHTHIHTSSVLDLFHNHISHNINGDI